MPAALPSHLILPFARCSGDNWLQAMSAVPANGLKNLTRLLRGMKLADTDEGDAHSLSTPHERVLAQALGLPAAVDGLIPWAAAGAVKAGLGEPGTAWAFVTPCHWAMGREGATMTDPFALALEPQDSRLLLAAMQPYFETGGITLHYLAPERWLAVGEVFHTLPTASLDRVLGRNVDSWLPGTKTAPFLRRLQNEMQMLLYAHPLNDLRTAKRLIPVNSFWLSGTGALTASTNRTGEDLLVPRDLARAAFNSDWAAYARAWQELDSTLLAQLLARQGAGAAVRLSLCSETGARTFETSSAGAFRRIRDVLKPQRPIDLLIQL